ncbi:MAG TPA: hypothetical protein VIG99_01070 [Myxococcaceae bacterium]|jgi:Tfp pilus assembly protein PilV
MKTRGHVLVEAMISAAIVAWALAGIAAGLVAGTKLLGTASVDRAATDVVTAQVERLRALPINNAAWAAGASDAGVLGHPTWTLVTVVTDDVDLDGGTAAPLTYKHATVILTYGASTWSAEAFK